MPWKLPESDAELLALAKSYPFTAPSESYLFCNGDALPLPPEQRHGDIFTERVAVIAHGSNRAPAQLKRKYGAAAEIPVTVGWLEDHDVVYSAHITQYGSVASTLQHTPGTRALVAINWLTQTQLRRMHETEGPSTYAYGRMTGITLRLEAGPAAVVSEAVVYLSTNGCLAHEGAVIGLAAITAEGRQHAELQQVEALTHVRDRFRPELPLDTMILRKIREPELRRALVAEMREAAVPARAPHFEKIKL